MTPQQKACVIFEAYGSNDRTRWKWAYDELVSTIKERDDLLAEVASLTKECGDLNRQVAANQYTVLKRCEAERQRLANELAALKKNFEAMKRNHDYLIEKSNKLLTTPPPPEKFNL